MDSFFVPMEDKTGYDYRLSALAGTFFCLPRDGYLCQDSLQSLVCLCGFKVSLLWVGCFDKRFSWRNGSYFERQMR